MRNAIHFTVWLFMAMQASVAFSQTEKTDSITPKDSTQTVKIERKDSIPLKTTDRMLKEVVIFGRRPSIKFNLKDNSINAQLQNIRPGNLNFNVLGFLGYLRQFGIKKCPKKLVISLLFCNFIVDNQLITNIYSDDYH